MVQSGGYDEEDAHRIQAWLDSFSSAPEDEEIREVARRILSMPGGNMAVAWLGAEFARTRRDLNRRLILIESNTNGNIRKAGLSGAGLGGGAAGLVMIIAAVVSKLLGIKLTLP